MRSQFLFWPLASPPPPHHPLAQHCSYYLNFAKYLPSWVTVHPSSAFVMPGSNSLQNLQVFQVIHCVKVHKWQ